jgi:hypothetical protein
MRLGVALAAVIAMTAPALADERKVLVLPLDGDASVEIRTKLTASVQRLARVLDGDVQVGGQGFADTAAVVGCDPSQAACAEEVRVALGVDELVYGTASGEPTGVAIVVAVTRTNGTEPREVVATLASTDSPEKVEPSLLPLFNNGPIEAPPPIEPPPPIETPPPERSAPVDHRKRNVAIACIAGGSALFVIGLLSWSAASDLQDQIDDFQPMTVAQFETLKELEDRATSRAWIGNLLVLGGLALGGYGGYALYKDRQGRSATVAPVVTSDGAAVRLMGAW